MPNKPKLLCVDDEPVNLKLLDTILTSQGYDVLTVKGGQDAIAVVQEKEVDLILLDAWYERF